MTDIKTAAKLLGRLGGSVKSEAKTKANRLNAKKPRPRKTVDNQPLLETKEI